jgi:hypothetical protein
VWGSALQRGLDVQLLQLYVGPLLGATSPERATRNTTVAATRSKLLVRSMYFKFCILSQWISAAHGVHDLS